MKRMALAFILVAAACSGAWSHSEDSIKEDLYRAKRIIASMDTMDASYVAKADALASPGKSEFETQAMFEVRIAGDRQKLLSEKELRQKEQKAQLAGLLATRYRLTDDMFTLDLGRYDSEQERFTVSVKISINGVIIDEFQIALRVPVQEARKLSSLFMGTEKALECSLIESAIRTGGNPFGSYSLQLPGYPNITAEIVRMAPEKGKETAEPVQMPQLAQQSPPASTPGATLNSPPAPAAVQAQATTVAAVSPAVASPVAGVDGISAELRKASFDELKTKDFSYLKIGNLTESQKSETFARAKRNNAGGMMLLNLLLPIGVGSLVQGNVAYGAYQLASTFLGVLIGAETEAQGIGAVFVANAALAYLGGLIIPFTYESGYNDALKAVLK